MGAHRVPPADKPEDASQNKDNVTCRTAVRRRITAGGRSASARSVLVACAIAVLLPLTTIPPSWDASSVRHHAMFFAQATSTSDGGGAVSAVPPGYFLLPIPPRRKEPPPEGWTARTVPYEISDGANVAIATRGVSILVTNDTRSTAWATERFGPPNVRTPRGAHWYFAARKGHVNLANAETAVGTMEFYAINKYALIPPSIHPSGVPYRWERPLPPVDQLPECPDLSHLWGAGDRPGGADGRKIPTFSLGPDRKIPHGKHNSFIVSVAYSLASRMPRAYGEELCGIVEGLTSAAFDDPEQHAKEVERAVKSAVKKYPRASSGPAPTGDNSSKAALILGVNNRGDPTLGVLPVDGQLAVRTYWYALNGSGYRDRLYPLPLVALNERNERVYIWAGEPYSEHELRHAPSFPMRDGVAIHQWLAAQEPTERILEHVLLQLEPDGAGGAFLVRLPQHSRTDTEIGRLVRSFHRSNSLPNLLPELRRFTVTPKLRTILQYVVGGPVYQVLRPDSPMVVCDAYGTSGTGKTVYTQAAINVVWGRRDTGIGGDVLDSPFRLGVIRSMTNLPILIDEASRYGADQTRTPGVRRGTSSQGMRVYPHVAPIVITRNTAYNDATSAAAWGGNERRRIPITMEAADVAAIAPRRKKWERARLWERPSAAWRHLLANRTCAELEKVIETIPDEREAVLALGAYLLGQKRVSLEARAESPEQLFLDWMTAAVAKYGMWRPVADGQAVPQFPDLRAMMRVEDGSVVWVTQDLIRRYEQETLRSGKRPLFTQLGDLRQLSAALGTTSADDIYMPTKPKVLRFGGNSARCARIPLDKRTIPGQQAQAVLPDPAEEGR